MGMHSFSIDRGGKLMIDTQWCRMMAAYNTEINRRIYAAADGVDPASRRADLGAFFGSLLGTLSHVLWADHMWMARFDGWPKPELNLRQSPEYMSDWPALRAARDSTDARLEEWAGRAELTGDLCWMSGANGREMTRPRAVLVTHMFNHQTHHRGQVHAMLTRLGARPGDTDLPWAVTQFD